MSKSHSKICTALIILFSVIFFSGNIIAAGLETPLLDYVGDFNYQYSHVDCIEYRANGNCKAYGTVKDWELTFFNIDITAVNYIDGSLESNPLNDPILNAWFEIGTLYNDDSPNNYIFGNTQPSGGSTGPVSFTLTDGTNTFMTAYLDNFVITPFFATRSVNAGYDMENITNISFNPGAPSSRYINELILANNNGALPANLFVNFTVNSGSSNFVADASGSIAGKMAAAPEPISMILFISGGATLAARRYFRKKTTS